MKGIRGDRNFVGEDVLDSVKISEGKCERVMQEGEREGGGVVEVQEPAENCRELFVIPTKKFRHC